jgi:hypothetical protein
MAENEQAESGASQAPQEKPKIIVDDDWKAQAQAEKEKLAKEAAEATAKGGAAGGATGTARGPRQLPPASFATLVNSLVTQTFLALGGMEDPRTKRRYVDLDLAKHHIDTLAVLEEKTKGNLSEEEAKMLDQGLYECRMQYVNIAQRVTTTAANPPGQGEE